MPQIGYSMTQAARLAQKMSPQQYMAATLLQSTIQDLRVELRQRQETNPAIEDIKWKDVPVLSDVIGDPPVGSSQADFDVPLDFTPDSPTASRALSSGDPRGEEALGNMQSASSDDPDERRLESVRAGKSKWDADREERRQHLFDSAVAPQSLEEHLRWQVEVSDFTKEERRLAEIVIGNLDDDGYFVGSLADITMGGKVSEKDILSVQRRICSTFDPPGIAARDLRECLLAQMDRLEDSPWEDEIRAVVENHLPDLVAGRFEKVRAAIGLSPDEWKRMMAEFTVFNRKPALQRWDAVDAGAGRQVDLGPTQYVYPEIHAVKRRGRWTAVVTDGSIPKIVISSDYRRMADDRSVPRDARAAIRNYVHDAEMLEDLLDDRQEKLRRVAQAVIDAQPGFFEKGVEGLRPLSRSTIAERVKLDDSTVSRAVSGKYMTTPFGTMELSSFFPSGVATAAGSEVTPLQVKARIHAFVDAEDPAHPLSDEAMAEKLKTEGFLISRRTVAKYREAEGIPGSSERRSRGKNL